VTIVEATLVAPLDPYWPQSVTERLGDAAPSGLRAIGPLSLLEREKTAFFCSARIPGKAILPIHDAARRLRDAGVTVVGGFHSPVEKECLRILLRGRQPIIICPARGIDTMRMPAEYRPAYEVGRLLFLSQFESGPSRVSQRSAHRRNALVAALAQRAYVGHANQGGRTEATLDLLRRWKVPILP
jgi:predicted Rossmann fold nucleotide-binding protein DprA/Smf involved in DNA uptake